MMLHSEWCDLLQAHRPQDRMEARIGTDGIEHPFSHYVEGDHRGVLLQEFLQTLASLIDFAQLSMAASLVIEATVTLTLALVPFKPRAPNQLKALSGGNAFFISEVILDLLPRISIGNSAISLCLDCLVNLPEGQEYVSALPDHIPITCSLHRNHLVDLCESIFKAPGAS